MRILGILENGPRGALSHTLCYVSVNRNGRSAFNGVEKPLFLIPPGKRSILPEAAIGFVISGEISADSNFLDPGDGVLFRIKNGTPFPLLTVEQGGFVSVSRNVRILRPVSVGVLTVSDKGSRGEREDRSGPALARCVLQIGAVVEQMRIVPDEINAIADVLMEWSDTKELNLVLATGGTGFSQRDVTPEALSLVAQKYVPGIGETMRNASMQITPKAMLSRGCAVIRGNTLIVALPGSERAATECFDAIVPALRHGIEILCGWDSECGSASGEHHHH